MIGPLAALSPAAAGPVIPHFERGSSCVRNNGKFCWDWFTAHWDDTFQPALLQHIELTAIAVGLGFVISFALALLAFRFGWMTTPITLAASLLYTIPSLALFILLVPLTDASLLTAEIALVSYTLLILFRNTLAGLQGVPEDVREAASGMGLTRLQTLLRVELPLAVPTIIAGLRIATVTIISLATVAAYITNSGLGAPIFNALTSSVFNTQLFGAGVLAIALALVADGLLVIGQRVLTPWASARRAT